MWLCWLFWILLTHAPNTQFRMLRMSRCICRASFEPTVLFADGTDKSFTPICLQFLTCFGNTICHSCKLTIIQNLVTTFVAFVCFLTHQSSSENASTIKENNLLPVGTNSFLYRSEAKSFRQSIFPLKCTLLLSKTKASVIIFTSALICHLGHPRTCQQSRPFLSLPTFSEVHMKLMKFDRIDFLFLFVEITKYGY